MKLSELTAKKVAGIPVVYIALVLAGAVAYYAWKLAPSAGPSDASGAGPAEGDTASEVGSGGDAGSVYDGLKTSGTVVVAPQPTPTTEAVAETNQTWLKAAIDYVVNEKKLANVGDAQIALQKYLDGTDLTFDEGAIRDAAVAKLKLPPEGIAKVGITQAAPAQKQFSGSGVHTVKGVNDNTPMKLAGLYYGSADWTHANFIASYNTSLGPPATTYTPGTKVTIPNYISPVYFTVTSTTRTFATVAQKNGTTAPAVFALNPTWSEPFNVNSKIRVK